MKLPVALYNPDQPDVMDDGNGAAVISNCLPRTSKSYGPMPSLTVYSGALDARCQGAIGVADSSGNAFAFAGTAAKLWKAAAGSTAWTDVSKALGYSTANDQRWSAAFWTPNQVIITNFSDPIQAFTLGTSTLFADLSSGAPKAKYIAVVKDFVVAAFTVDGTDGTRPTRVWWSAIGNPTSWPTPGSAAAAAAESDFQDVNLGDWGQITGIVGGLGSAHGLIFFERGIARMNYVGGAAIFDFEPVAGAVGSQAPGSIAQYNGFAIYLGPDDLYLTDGAVCTPLGADQWAKTLMSDIDQASFYRISGTFDPINKLYFLGYPSGSGSGSLNKLLSYNWMLKRAVPIDALGQVELIFNSLSFGYSLDGLDATGFTLDTLPFGLDSRAWTGGKPMLSAFDTSHRLCYPTGPALSPIVDTTEAQLVDGGRALVTGCRPIVDSLAATVALGVRESIADPVVFGTPVAMNSLRACPQFAEGRFHVARLSLPAGDGFTQIAGLEVTGEDVASAGAF